MPFENQVIADDQKLPVGFRIKSRGGILLTNIAQLPEGSTATVVSSNPELPVVFAAEGDLNGHVTSPVAGTTHITMDAFIPDTDGPEGLPEFTIHEEFDVEVKVSAPGSVEPVVGAAVTDL